MNTIFVTYGNQNFYNSLKRIKKEAEESKVFTKIYCFTDKDLPVDVTQHILYQYNRGGGYWLWKPWVVLKVLQDANDDDIVVFSDAGNTIFKNTRKWDKLFAKLNGKDGIFFYNGSKLIQYTRRNIFEYFNNISPCQYQIVGNFFIVKKSALPLIKEWYKTMLEHPELVLDVTDDERIFENKMFIENRHDQAVLSGIIYSYQNYFNLIVKPTTSEGYKPGKQVVFNSRISDTVQACPFRKVNKMKAMIHDTLIKPYRQILMWYYKISIKRKSINEITMQ